MNKPNFFIVGAPKCGTTAMHDYLRQHPEIFMPVEKEPSFFHVNHPSPQFQRYRGNLGKYIMLFDEVTSEKVIGEASAGYLYSELSAQEIYEFAPHAKIIIMIREPVDMLNSLYQHQLYMGDVTGETLEDILQKELNFKELLSTNSENHYLPRVQYSRHIQRYIDTFGRSQVHVILFDHMRKDVQKTYKNVLTFLDVDLNFTPEFTIVNSSKTVRNTPIHQLMSNLNITPQAVRDSELFHKLTSWMSPTFYRKLISVGVSFYSRPQTKDSISPDLIHEVNQYLKPEIEQLSLLIDYDLSHWLSEPISK